jgi:hypothetical protein
LITQLHGLVLALPVGAAIYAATKELTWLAVGVAIDAALSWNKPQKSDDKE